MLHKRSTACLGRAIVDPRSHLSREPTSRKNIHAWRRPNHLPPGSNTGSEGDFTRPEDNQTESAEEHLGVK
eukprot:715760-Alexandrium_andersonii.AAC.1